MFSVHIPTPEHSREPDSKVARSLLGKLLGFVAGLTLAYAFDALVLHHAFQQSIMRNDWGVSRTAHGVVSYVLR